MPLPNHPSSNLAKLANPETIILLALSFVVPCHPLTILTLPSFFVTLLFDSSSAVNTSLRAGDNASVSTFYFNKSD